MIKKFYILAWYLLIGSVIISVFTGSLTGLGMVTYSLIGLALVHALMLWSVIVNTREAEPR